MRRILYPAFVLTIIATVWTMAEAKAADDAVHRAYWPPLQPSITEVLEADVDDEAADDDALAPPEPSLHEVFLEHDEVVGVR